MAINSQTRQLAAYYYFQDNKHLDVNEEINGDIEYYHSESQKIYNWYIDFLLLSPNLSEEDLTFRVYEITKKYFGEDGKSIRHGFQRIYQLLFETVTGPRLPVFIYIFGINEFKALMESKIRNPFVFPNWS